ncbi:MAG: protein-export chaperone SecB, partial [Halanaerobiales bacterium]|nr:protein-export chaperone SecB [Halanaerobiales bacterium]
MNKKNSVLEFNHYYVDEFIFKKNDNFENKENKKINVDFDFDFDIKRNQNDFKRIVTCRIFDEDFAVKNKPFYLKMKIIGLFTLTNFDEENQMHQEIIKKNTLAILFPYIRSIISHMTMEMQIGPVQMPPMNI